MSDTMADYWDRFESEKDPTGRDAHAPGAKLDHGKLQAAQLLRLFPRALAAFLDVAQFGANKYTLGGWQEVPNGLARYEDAGLRHQMKRWQGETVDADSGHLHLAHEAWNALAVLELYLREEEANNG